MKSVSLKNFLKNIVFFAVITGILILSLLGSATINSYIIPVGKLQLSAFNNGLSLYQMYKGSYYVFSPFNDYVFDNGARISIISKQDVDTKNYKTGINSYPWSGVIYSLENFAGTYRPEISFATREENISYEAFASQNNLTVTRTVIFPGSSGQKILGSTLSFETNDIIFDKSGNLLSLALDNDVNTFVKATGIALTPRLDEKEITIPGKEVFIASKNIAGVIAVKASKNQILKVNWDSKLIEVEESVAPEHGAYKTSVNITVFNDPKEALYGN